MVCSRILCYAIVSHRSAGWHGMVCYSMACDGKYGMIWYGIWNMVYGMWHMAYGMVYGIGWYGMI